MTDDLFRSAAYYYARFRPFYPEPIIRDIVRSLHLTKEDRVIDVGSGTGQLAIQIAKYVKEVFAVEPDKDMIREGKKFCRKHHVHNIRWLRLRAEDLGQQKNLGKFKLASFGTSLHWMDEIRVLKSLDPLITEDGGVVITGSWALWSKPTSYEKKIKLLIQKYLGKRRRAGSGTFRRRKDSHSDVLKRSPFSQIRFKRYVAKRKWSSAEIIGQLYSTSFANKAVLGDKRKNFEKDLRALLKILRPSGVFTRREPYDTIFARRRSHEPDHGSVV